MSSTQGKFILDKKDIPADPNAYVYRDPRRGGGRWSLYFYDRETKERHRLVLKDGNGAYPPPTIEGQDAAWMLVIAKYVELKGKSERGEAIRSLKFSEMVKKFQPKERKGISNIPNDGIKNSSTNGHRTAMGHRLSSLKRAQRLQNQGNALLKT